MDRLATRIQRDGGMARSCRFYVLVMCQGISYHVHSWEEWLDLKGAK